MRAFKRTGRTVLNTSVDAQSSRSRSNKATGSRGLFLSILVLAAIPGALEAGGVDWPMLAHDAGRSGATATELRPPFERKWYRLFADEGLMAGVQPVIAESKVFVGPFHGILHAIHA